MLFDLNDYASEGFIGPASATNNVNELSWTNAYDTYNSAKDAWMKAANEYFISGMVVNPLSNRAAIYTAYSDLYEKYTQLTNTEAPAFWGAMLSLNPSVTDESSFASTYPTRTELHYTVFSASIYNAYKAKFKSVMSAFKNLTIVIDGSTYAELV